jgi:hypothetical protein
METIRLQYDPPPSDLLACSERGAAGANSRGKVQGGNTNFLSHGFVFWQSHSHKFAITFSINYRYSFVLFRSHFLQWKSCRQRRNSCRWRLRSSHKPAQRRLPAGGGAMTEAASGRVDIGIIMANF